MPKVSMKGVDEGKGEECGVNFMGTVWEALSDVTMKTYLKLSKSQRGFCTEGSGKTFLVEGSK